MRVWAVPADPGARPSLPGGRALTDPDQARRAHQDGPQDSCCATTVQCPPASTGPGRIGPGWPSKVSPIPPNKSCSRSGLAPKEHSSGRKIARGNITKAGNLRARRVLVEGAWTYRLPARMGEDITRRNEGLPEAIRAAAWKAQVRLCPRYRRLQNTGKPQNVIVVAIAREMAAFVWAIARMAQPAVRPA